jgi:glutathione synthase/RimK-type ligase-like ATP-grasp enzyme
VGLATWSELPDLCADDRLLLDALASDGIPARPAVWNDTALRWERFGLVVLRSTWDYHRRLAEFLGWVDRVAGRTRLLNDPRTVRWNSHKTYLRELERSGIPIVPTVWGSELDSVTDTLEERGWERGVLKPAVSASGEGAHLLRLGDRASNEAAFRELLAKGEVLLQPYLAAVNDPGERSLVFLDGAYSHAVLRAPRFLPGSPLREGAPVEPLDLEREVAVRALAVVEPRPLYARVDLVTGSDGSPRLMELELIEPLLFLGTSPGAAGRLARAIAQRLA